jgi:hypothetical protein
VATIDDDAESKARVQEAVWTWTGRILVLLVVFGAGAFLGWILWGTGNAGAVQLRPRVGELESQLTEQRKKVIDCEGKLVVVQGRLNEVQRAANRPAPGATPPPTP